MCAGALWLAAASRWPVRGLPLLFLWAFPKATLDTHGPRPQTLLGSRQACPGLSVAVRSLPLLFTHGPRPQTFLQAAAWPTKLLLWASEGNAASLWPVRSLPLLFTHGPRPQTFLQAAAWPTKLFLWASEGNVRHPRARPSNAPRQPAGLPRPLCGLSEACLFSSPTGPARKRFCRPQLGPQSFFYGLPKATLDTHGPRPQRLRGLSEACLFSSPTGPARKRFCKPQLGHKASSMGFRRQRGLSVACPKPASSLHPRAPPANVSAGRSLAHKASSMGFRRQRGLSVACPKPASSLHPRAPPANVSAGSSLAHKASSMGFRRQRGLSVACPKPASSLHHGPRPQTFLQAAAWPTKLFLWASEGNVRHPRAPPSK